MKTHHITTSILSLANPWLDFLPPDESAEWATEINNEMNALCSAHPPGHFFAFATLPLSSPPEAIIKEINRLRNLAFIKGIILSTTALGSGLDDPAMHPILSALQSAGILVFLHPHYGLPSPDSAFGPRSRDYGHVLPLSLGFPMETTIAFTRLYLSCAFDRFPHLKILIAHAGGTLPFLVGRIESCISHERHYLAEPGLKPQRSLSEVLKENVWLDAVVYSPTGIKAAIDVVGVDHVLFGTDHPFFPPLEGEEGTDTEQASGEEEGDTRHWPSASTNISAIHTALEEDSEGVDMILGGNATRLLGLDLPPSLHSKHKVKVEELRDLSLEPSGSEEDAGDAGTGTDGEREKERSRGSKEGLGERAGMGWGY